MDSSGDQHQAGETTESQKTFEIMEIKKALELFGMQKGTISLKLLVRDEYKVAEKAIESNQGHGKGGMMITGQSGIGALSFNHPHRLPFKPTSTHDPGKTSCLIYLLIVRLLKKELTFYQRTATLVYMFLRAGASSRLARTSQLLISYTPAKRGSVAIGSLSCCSTRTPTSRRCQSCFAGGPWVSLLFKPHHQQ